MLVFGIDIIAMHEQIERDRRVVTVTVIHRVSLHSVDTLRINALRWLEAVVAHSD
jgi:hypothetical protein